MREVQRTLDENVFFPIFEKHHGADVTAELRMDPTAVLSMSPTEALDAVDNGFFGSDESRFEGEP